MTKRHEDTLEFSLESQYGIQTNDPTTAGGVRGG